MNAANALTVARIVIVPFFLYLAAGGAFGPRLAALVLFILAALTDLIDGILARRRGETTDFGRIADPIADKVLVGAAFIFLSIEYPRLVPIWATGLILVREIAITAWRLRWLRKGIVMSADKFGKIKTTLQMSTIILTLLLTALLGDGGPGIEVLRASFAGRMLLSAPYPLMIIATITTVLSGLEYFHTNLHRTWGR